MTTRHIVWQGETYITVKEAASWYTIEIVEIDRWVSEELLEPPRVIAGERAIRVAALDRLARLVHYSRVLELHDTAIRLVLRGAG
jgi:hypothetical protein